MKTNFVLEARALASDFPEGSKERAILLNLATCCVGRANAITLPVLGGMFGVSGHWIQQRIIAASRKCGAFLGTCRSGVFVIADEEDARVMLAFYDERIKAETKNAQTLASLI